MLVVKVICLSALCQQCFITLLYDDQMMDITLVNQEQLIKNQTGIISTFIFTIIRPKVVWDPRQTLTVSIFIFFFINQCNNHYLHTLD